MNTIQPIPRSCEQLSATPFVSVIMNCYNSAQYLRAALDSVRAQSYADWEIIFWDNRSTDESAAIFKSFNDRRLCYFLAPEHTILGKAKGLAIEQARGQWLAFLDCDDLWRPDKLERQVEIIDGEGPELGLVYGRMEVIVEDTARTTPLAKRALAVDYGGSVERLPEGRIFSRLIKENIIPQPSALVRHAAYLHVGGIDANLKYGWDYDLFVKLSREYTIRAVQDVVCSYRIHGSNLTYAHVENKYLESISIARRYLPGSEARNGIRSHQTCFAADEIRQGRILQGLWRVLRHGDVGLFFVKTLIALRRVWKRGGSTGNHRFPVHPKS